MRCYTEKAYRIIQFDKIEYQKFLKNQGLSERDIKRLNILFITNFTPAHFSGSPTLAPGGAYFQHTGEYVAKMNDKARGLYRPSYLPDTYAAIFLRPGQHKTPIHMMNPIFLNEVLLHETRHHIQHCLKLSCMKSFDSVVDSDAPSERDQPWEMDAEDFAAKYVKQVSFLSIVLPPTRRSDLVDL